jgi:cysteine-rich repeat protein
MFSGTRRWPHLMVVLSLGLTLVDATAARAGSPLSNDPSALAVCQEIVRDASLGLAIDTRRAMASCLVRGIECLVNDPATSSECCARVAGKCDGAFDKLATASRRFTNHLTRRRCASVPFAEIVADLGYAELFATCRALDPAVEVTDLEGLAECLRRVVIGETTCQIATLELPRAAEALACLGLEEAFVGATGTDPLTCRAPSCAASPTPSPTATRTMTPSPAATATSIPVATATTTAIPVPTITVTATPQPTATVTAVIVVPTATLTPQPTLTPLPTLTATRTVTPVPTATATPSGPSCGDGVVEQGESCDDGNTSDCDTCPSDCHAVPSDCPTPAALSRHTQQIRITGPTELGAVQVCLKYPAGTVGLPGASTVTGRISGFAGSNNVVDFNNAAQIALLPAGSQSQFTLTLSLDRCVGAPVPPLTDFKCVTKDASDTLGNDLKPPTIVDCTPVTP